MLQLLLIAGVIGWAALRPPARGAMLVVPMAGESLAPALARAVAQGAGLLKEGPIAGSLILVGEREAIADALAGSSTLLIAAPARACGDVA